jgi:hypothetical protein
MRQAWIKKDSVITITNAGAMLPTGFVSNPQFTCEDGSILTNVIWYGDRMRSMGFERV